MDKIFKYLTRLSRARVAIFFAITAILLLSLVWQDSIDKALGLREWYNGFGRVHSGGVSVHFVDVGQGDAIIVQLPDQKTILIDAGSQSSVGNLLDYIQNNLVRYGNFVYFDYIICTSANQNRVGGLPEIVQKYANKENTTIFRPNTLAINSSDPSYFDLGANYLVANSFNTHDSAAYRRAVTAIHNSGCVVEVNHLGEFVIASYDFDASKQYFFSIIPFADMDLLGSDFSTSNSSPIMLLEYQDKRVVFSGTAQERVEKLFVQKYSSIFGNDFGCNAIMLGGNGSPNSSSQEYLDFLLKPELVVDTKIIVSVSEQNSNTLPDRSVIDRLKHNGVAKNNILTTAKYSHILLNISNNNPYSMSAIASQEYLLGTHPYILWWRHIVLFCIFATFTVLTKVKGKYDLYRK